MQERKNFSGFWEQGHQAALHTPVHLWAHSAVCMAVCAPMRVCDRGLCFTNLGLSQQPWNRCLWPHSNHLEMILLCRLSMNLHVILLTRVSLLTQKTSSALQNRRTSWWSSCFRLRQASCADCEFMPPSKMCIYINKSWWQRQRISL